MGYFFIIFSCFIMFQYLEGMGRNLRESFKKKFKKERKRERDKGERLSPRSARQFIRSFSNRALEKMKVESPRGKRKEESSSNRHEDQLILGERNYTQNSMYLVAYDYIFTNNFEGFMRCASKCSSSRKNMLLRDIILLQSGKNTTAKLMIKGIVEIGADLNEKVENHELPLCLACTLNKYLFVQLLVKLGAQVDLKDGSGVTSLAIAERNKDPRCQTILLQGFKKLESNNAIFDEKKDTKKTNNISKQK